MSWRNEFQASSTWPVFIFCQIFGISTWWFIKVGHRRRCKTLKNQQICQKKIRQKMKKSLCCSKAIFRLIPSRYPIHHYILFFNFHFSIVAIWKRQEKFEKWQKLKLILTPILFHLSVLRVCLSILGTNHVHISEYWTKLNIVWNWTWKMCWN